MTTSHQDGALDAQASPGAGRLSVAAVACGVLAFVAAGVFHFLIVPGIVLGLASIVLGWMARRRGSTERGAIAATLGVVAVLLVPIALGIEDSAEQWGRECALDPAMDPNC